MYRAKRSKAAQQEPPSAEAIASDQYADAVAADVAAITGQLSRKEQHSRDYSSVPSGATHTGGAATATLPGQPTSTAADTDTQRSILEFKGRFTTPSMQYNSLTRAIEVNPAYDRNAVVELSRAQGALLQVLRQGQQQPQQKTPKELLYGLERAVLFLLASTAVADDNAAFIAAASDADADQRLPALETFFANHSAPAKAITATAYALAEGLSRQAVDGYVEELKSRIAAESDPIAEKHRSDSERHAFSATRNNLHDFTQVHSNFLVAYESIPRAAGALNSDGVDRGAEVSAGTRMASAALLSEAYYSLLRWVLAVDPDRRALHSQSTGAATQPTASHAVEVTEFDAYSGKITLVRQNTGSPWGCVFNARGHLVGLSNELRNSSAAGERLFKALQHKSGSVLGVPVLEANRRRIRSAELSEEELAAQRGNITMALRESLTSESKTLHLTIPKEPQGALTAPEEVVFELMSQGGENVTGQRVLLVLRRANVAIPWGVKMVRDANGSLRLQEFSDNIRLSATAKDYLFEHRGELVIAGLNHKELSGEAITGAALRDLISNSLVMALWITVTASPTGSTASAEKLAASPPEEDEEEQLEEGDADINETAAVDAQDGHDEIEDEAEEREAIEEDEDPAELAADNEDEERGEELEGNQEEHEALEGVEEPADDRVEESPRDEVEVEEAQRLEAAQNTQRTISSIRKGWELDDGEDDAVEGDAQEKVAADEGDDAEDNEPRALIEDDGEEADEKVEPLDAHGDEDAENRALLKESGVAIDGDDEIDAGVDEAEDILEGVSGFSKPVTTTAVAASADGEIDAAVLDILAEHTDVAMEAVGEEVAVEVTEKRRGRKPGSKNKSTKAKPKKKPKKKSTKKTRASKKSSKASEEIEEEEEEAQEDDIAEAEAPENDQLEGGEKTTEVIEDGAAEKPLVKGMKTLAEIAIETAEESATKRAASRTEELTDTPTHTQPKSADDGAGGHAGDGVARVSIADLVDAEPLVFPNKVVMEQFDGREMTLKRPDVTMPWQLKVGFAGDDMVLTGLPAAIGDPSVPADHPYLRYLEPFSHPEKANGNRCLVESVNGMELSLVTKANRDKVFSVIKNAPALKLGLKFIRRR